MTAPRATAPSRTADWLGTALAGLLAIVVWLPRLRGPMDLRSDSAVYYILGTSIAEGHGYRLLNEPGAIQAVQYPPLFPLIAAAFQWLLGTSDPVVVAPWLRLACFAFFVGFAIATYAVLRRWLSRWMSLLGTVIVVLHGETFTMSELFYPEVLFALLTLCFFLVLWRRDSPRAGVAAGVLATLAFFTRTVGIAALFAWVVDSLVHRRLKQAMLRAAVAVVPVVAWQGYVAQVTRGAEYATPAYAYQRAPYMFYNVTYASNITTYVDPMAPESGPATTRDLAQRVLQNVAGLPAKLGETVSEMRASYELPWKLHRLPAPFDTPWLVTVVLVFLGAVVIAGWGMLIVQREWSVAAYLAAMVGLMCVTPWPEQFNRYLMPAQPLLVACLLIASVAATRWQGRAGRASTALLTVAIVMILAQQLLWTRIMYRTRREAVFQGPAGNSIPYRDFFFGAPYRALDGATDWLRANAARTDICAGSMPHGVYLRAGLRCVMVPFEIDPARAQALLDGVPVTYLIVDQGLALEAGRYMARVVQAYPSQWREVYRADIPREPGRDTTGTLAIYRRTSVPAPSDSVRGDH